MAAELRFPAMGSVAHVVVVGGPRSLIDRAGRRLAELERMWSRFRPDSEVSRLNGAGGTWTAVSHETLMLVQRAVQGFELTGGLFDPTLLGAVRRAGYSRPFEELKGAPAAAPPPDARGSGAAGIRFAPGLRVRLPRDVGFDPGGIGKGLAADIVCGELRRAGAAGACVNLGGDVRVSGEGPEGDGWTVAIEHPERPAPLALVGIGEGAVASSTTLLRRWNTPAGPRHHLIDPRTGESAGPAVEFASVVSGDAWRAEVLAKAVLLAEREAAWGLLAAAGGEGLRVTAHGPIEHTPGLARHLGGTFLPAA
jgi:FAD:protein FMN transferase